MLTVDKLFKNLLNYFPIHAFCVKWANDLKQCFSFYNFYLSKYIVGCQGAAQLGSLVLGSSCKVLIRLWLVVFLLYLNRWGSKDALLRKE